MSAVGFGLVGGLWLLEQVRTTHEEQKALPTYDVDANRARQSTAQSLIVGGLVVGWRRVGGASVTWGLVFALHRLKRLSGADEPVVLAHPRRF